MSTGPVPTASCSQLKRHTVYQRLDGTCHVCSLVDAAPPLGPATRARLGLLLRPALERTTTTHERHP